MMKAKGNYFRCANGCDREGVIKAGERHDFHEVYRRFCHIQASDRFCHECWDKLKERAKR